MLWILLALWVINILISVATGRIRIEWLQMQTWLRDQIDVLLQDPDWLDEANSASVVGLTINDWAVESIKIGAMLLFATQILVFGNIFTLLLMEDPYITTGFLAFAQSGVFVYTWIMIQRYLKSKGMCYGVRANIEALNIYKAEIDDGGNKSSSTDDRGDA